MSFEHKIQLLFPKKFTGKRCLPREKRERALEEEEEENKEENGTPGTICLAYEKR